MKILPDYLASLNIRDPAERRLDPLLSRYRKNATLDYWERLEKDPGRRVPSEDRLGGCGFLQPQSIKGALCCVFRQDQLQLLVEGAPRVPVDGDGGGRWWRGRMVRC